MYELGFELLPHSPDVAPCDFYLFSVKTNRSVVRRFSSNNQVIDAINRAILKSSRNRSTKVLSRSADQKYIEVDVDF